MTVSPKVQMKINGTWTDVTRYDTNTKIMGDITVARGTSNVQDRTPASSCTWTWEDPNGVYNNENPRSPYYGVLPRNTPVRMYVTRPTSALLIPTRGAAARGETVDKAALDIVGDIDVRIEIEPKYWRRFGSNSNKFMVFCGKWEQGGNRSWIMYVSETGFLTFSVSTDGSNANVGTATVALPSTGRIAIRATLDVDNGAGGRTYNFYTSSSIGGTWTALGAAVVQAGGAIAIFSSAADLEVGSANNGTPSGISSAFYDFAGRIYAFEMYNGIAGTLVAQANYYTQTSGATSFSDGLGNTWILVGGPEITNADYRFHGEFSAPVQSSEVSADGVGKDVQIAGEAGGLIRRLTINQSPDQSPIYRNFTNFAANGWWTGEDASGATVASSGIDGGAQASLTDITFAGYDSTLAGSAGVMTCGGTGPIFQGMAKIVATTTETHFLGYFKFPTVPLSAQIMFTMYSNGTVRRWEWVVDATTYTLKGYDATGTQTVTKSSAFGTGGEPTNWIAYHMQLTNVAGTITIKSEWHTIGTDLFFSATATGTLTYAGTNGILTQILVQGIAALSGVRFAHVLATTQVGLIFFNANLYFAKFSRGFAGETADGRFIRICTEQGIAYSIWGLIDGTEFMGAQPIDTIMNILYQIQEVDGGLITEARDQSNTLEYRTRTFLLNQYGLSLSYTVGKNLSGRFTSTPDDTNIKNDIVLSRANGGSARATLAVGPMSTQASPNGIGRVPDAPTINNYVDSRLPYLAYYALMFGTWPEARYPNVEIELSRSPYVNSSALKTLALLTDLGAPVAVTDMPQFTTADSISLMTRGSTETINNFLHTITWNTVPYGPYRVSELSTVTGEELRADSARDASYVGQTQLSAATNSATSLTATTLSGPVLPTTAGDPTQFPFDAWQAGERITVTAVTSATSPQTLTVTRSVNGVVKAVAANTPLLIVQYFNAAL